MYETLVQSLLSYSLILLFKGLVPTVMVSIYNREEFVNILQKSPYFSKLRELKKKSMH